MKKLSLASVFVVAILAWLTLPGARPALADEAFFLGPEACADCHKAEETVWEATKHATSFKEFHRDAKTKDVLKVTGDQRSPKQSPICLSCHYTTAQKDASSPADQVAGPSCESCHGAASNWIKIHNDFGGPGVKEADEKADHKAKRIADAIAAGMRRPEMKYDLAANCYGCHALGRADVAGDVLGKMIDAGHPTNDEFEFVAFSMGQVKHRFYPPDTSANKDPTPQEAAEWYAIGQAAALVAATEGLAKNVNDKYKAAQQARIDKAKAVLGNIPQAKDLLAKPTADAGRAFAAAIKGQDLTKLVGTLPDKSTYK